MPMTQHTISGARAAIAAFVITLVSIGAGCATRGYDQAAATAGSIEKAATELEVAQQHIDNANAALARMAEQPAADLRPAFKEYGRALDDLEHSLNAMHRHAADLSDRRRAYMETWNAQSSEIVSTPLRERSLERRDEVAQLFADARASYEEARDSFMPLLREMRDIQRLLSVDLTANGVQTAQSAVDRILERSPRTREALGDLVEDFRRISRSLEPSTLSDAQFATD